MYDLLKRAFLLRAVSAVTLHHFLSSSLLMDNQGITKFVQLADDSTQVPKLQKKRYADFKLTPNEWSNLDLLRQILKVPTFVLVNSVTNRVNVAPHSCSTTILFRAHSDSLPRVPDNRIFAYVVGSC
jgi:hypothetical protein